MGVDAAILFADILLVLEPLGVGNQLREGDGPVIAHPVRDAASSACRASTWRILSYVFRPSASSKQALGGQVPLIGFAGAPFARSRPTRSKGGGSRNYALASRGALAEAFHALMTDPARLVTSPLTI